MGLPGDLNVISVTASYPNIAGEPQSGTVVFDPGQQITDSTGHVILSGAVTVNVFNGTMQPVTLPCTDNSGLNPTGFTYKVTATVGGVAYAAFSISLPHSLGSSVDLSALVPVVSSGGSSAYGVLAASQTWTGANTFTGETIVATPVNSGDAATKAYVDAHAGVASVNGKTGTVTLAASDVSALPTAGGTMGGWLAPDVATLTFVGSGTTLVNAALGNAFNLTLTASTTTLGAPSNPVDGQVIRFRVTQGSGGSFTLAYASAYDFGTSGSPTLSTSAGKVDILGFEYVASLSKWCYLGSGLGF